jgi:hypothetical protein
MILLVVTTQIALSADIFSDRIALGIYADGSLVNNTQTLGILWDGNKRDGAPLGGDFILVRN